MKPVVTSAKMVTAHGSVEVKFQDGHKLTVFPNRGGFGEPNEIECVILSLKQHHVAVFNSPYQYIINRRPFGFAKVEAGYSLERIADYWQAAYDCVRTRSRGRMTDAWRIVSLATRELEEVRAGKWPCPE